MNSLQVADSGAPGQGITNGGALTITSGGLLYTGTNGYSITGGSVLAGTGGNATNSDLIVQDYGTGSLNISSAITTRHRARPR